MALVQAMALQLLQAAVQLLQAVVQAQNANAIQHIMELHVRRKRVLKVPTARCARVPPMASVLKGNVSVNPDGLVLPVILNVQCTMGRSVEVLSEVFAKQVLRRVLVDS